MVSIKNVTYINEIGIRSINEDHILVDEASRLFGVFDGASSLVPYTSSEGKTGGYLAASIARDTLRVAAMT